MSRLYRRPEVESRTGLKKSELYRRAARGDFPRPVRLGRRYSVWVAGEVDGWIERRVAEARGEAPA